MELKKIFGSRVLGPEFPQISKIQLYHLKILLIKFERGSKYSEFKRTLSEAIRKFESVKEFSQLKIVIDVDPN